MDYIMRLKKGIFLASLALPMSTMAADIALQANQIGYPSQAVKQAMICNSTVSEYSIVDAKSGTVVYKDSLPKAKSWRASGDNVTWADFTKFSIPGEYKLKIGTKESEPFKVQKDGHVYDELLTQTMKGFYFWRCSTPIESKFSKFKGIDYSRKAGHPDDKVTIYTNAKGTKVHRNAQGGWYDAGDYGKYTVNAAITLHTLLTAYQLNPKYFDNFDLNIPESGNHTADILDECMYELKWMLLMQDEADGSVFNKVTTLQFPDMIMPADDRKERFLIGKTADCAYDFAATMALAARVYKGNTDYPDFSDKALAAAKKAYDWAASQRHYVMFQNPSDCNTGSYASSEMKDEQFWAASELLISTGDAKYASILKFSQYFTVPFWGDVSTLGLISLMHNENALQEKVDIKLVEKKFKELADDLYSIYNESVGRVPMREYFWGSNGQVANSGMVLAMACKRLNSEKYLSAAQYCLDYILGANATGYCFVTGFGSKSPVNIHDRRSVADGISTPIPGYLVGGPSLDQTSDCGNSSYPTVKYPAKAYLDMSCSYSTNEIALNWNAPLVSLISQIVNAYK